MKRSIAIVHREAAVLIELELLLRRGGYSIEGVYNSPEEFKANTTWEFDTAVLDLSLKSKQTDFKLAQSLNEKSKPFIFLTSSLDKNLVKRACKYSPKSYISLPVNDINVLGAFEILFSNQEATILVQGLFGIKEMNPRKIQLIETNKNYLEITTESGLYRLRSTLKDILHELPSNFVRVHRFYAVNTDYIDQKSNSQIVIDGRIIPISRNYKFEISSLG
ncbi:MAG: DNA-binding LytR/AlgR family response regulator [Salibacteraceae bacterium]|jgi:DNA-binding LytR/AlgR family response regulator|tara:strand:- start:1792 stop:2451 length:660 start_codon:yes stop_codon:yes gene_type:complete